MSFDDHARLWRGNRTTLTLSARCRAGRWRLRENTRRPSRQLRVAPSGAATTVFTGTFTPDVLTRATDIVVGTDHVALVEDPNANVIRRIDLNTGILLSDLPGFSVVNQHLALDAAGDVYAAGREIAPDGRTLSTFPNWTDQFGIDLIGAADDLLQAHCAYVKSNWACEINLFHCP